MLSVHLISDWYFAYTFLTSECSDILSVELMPSAKVEEMPDVSANDAGWEGCARPFCSIRRPLLCVDLLPVLGISLPPHGVEVAVGGTVLAQILVRVIPGNVGAGVEPNRILAVTVAELDLHEKTTVRVHRG